MVARDAERGLMHFDRQWSRRIEQRLYDAEGIFDLLPFTTLFAAQDVHEFIEDLDADDATSFQQRVSLLTAPIICAERIDDDVGVEERSNGHLPLLCRT